MQLNFGKKVLLVLMICNISTQIQSMNKVLTVAGAGLVGTIFYKEFESLICMNKMEEWDLKCSMAYTDSNPEVKAWAKEQYEKTERELKKCTDQAIFIGSCSKIVNDALKKYPANKQ